MGSCKKSDEVLLKEWSILSKQLEPHLRDHSNFKVWACLPRRNKGFRWLHYQRH